MWPLFIVFLFFNLIRFSQMNPCDIPNLIDLQSATFIYPIIVRVQPIDGSFLVRIRELLKYPRNEENSFFQVNAIFSIDVNDRMYFVDDETCSHLISRSNIDLIIFLNQTRNPIRLFYPAVQSTVRIRHQIDAVLHAENYSPQVIVRTRLDRALLSRDYSLQCNARGNPIPRLLWTKTSHLPFPSSKQCLKSPCRIYSIQSRYQSTLYFQSLMINDSGIYHCHAENPLNSSVASIELQVDSLESNVTTLGTCFCHGRGQCVQVNKQWKCLCNESYFGVQCELDSNDLRQQQIDAIRLLKSRFALGSILCVIAVVLFILSLISYFLAKQRRNQLADHSSDRYVLSEDYFTYDMTFIRPLSMEKNTRDLSVRSD